MPRVPFGTEILQSGRVKVWKPFPSESPGTLVCSTAHLSIFGGIVGVLLILEIKGNAACLLFDYLTVLLSLRDGGTRYNTFKHGW